MSLSDIEAYCENLPMRFRYAYAACLLAIVFFIRLGMAPLNFGVQFLSSYPLVALSFYLFEAQVGVFVLLFTALINYYFFFEPNMSFAPTVKSVASTLIFILSAGMIGVIIQRMHVYRRNIVQFETQKLQKVVKESNRKLELAAEGAKIGIFQWDLASNKVYISGASCEHMGFPPRTREIAYDEFLKRIHSADRPLVINAHAGAIETGNDFEVDYRLIRPDKTGRWLSSIGRSVAARSGGAKHIECVIIDITKRKRLERELVQLNNDLEEKVQIRTAELLRANEALASVTRHDPLTGLSNRLAAEERLSEEFARMKRTSIPYAALMLDIDFFKKVNDTYGHGVGDEVIKLVAVTCKQNLRVTDFIARYGGEEFLILLPSVDLEQARQAAEKIRSAIDEAHHNQVGKVTVSIGIAMAFPDQRDGEAAVKEADDQLYEAKKGGRNRVVAKLSS